LTIFRSVDPGLVHVFHKIECDMNLSEEQLIMCMGSKSTSIASQRNLANLIYDKKLFLIEPKFETLTQSSSTLKLTSQQILAKNIIGKNFPNKNKN
jgi:hypothetical protein